jgi:hypothetical protein
MIMMIKKKILKNNKHNLGNTISTINSRFSIPNKYDDGKIPEVKVLPTITGHYGEESFRRIAIYSLLVYI